MTAAALGVPYILSQAIHEITLVIASHGDGLTTDGMYQLEGLDRLMLLAWNADNHQLTWGVLRQAFYALFDYMERNDNFGAARFDIYDGNHQVGEGMIA